MLGVAQNGTTRHTAESCIVAHSVETRLPGKVWHPAWEEGDGRQARRQGSKVQGKEGGWAGREGEDEEAEGRIGLCSNLR